MVFGSILISVLEKSRTYCIKLTYPIFQDEATTILTKFSMNHSSRSVICKMFFWYPFREIKCVLWDFGCQAIISSKSFLVHYFSLAKWPFPFIWVYTLQLRQWQRDVLASSIEASFSSYSIFRQIHDPVRVGIFQCLIFVEYTDDVISTWRRIGSSRMSRIRERKKIYMRIIAYKWVLANAIMRWCRWCDDDGVADIPRPKLWVYVYLLSDYSYTSNMSKMDQSNPELKQRSVVSSFVYSDAGAPKVALFRRSEKVSTYQYVSKNPALLLTPRVQIDWLLKEPSRPHFGQYRGSWNTGNSSMARVERGDHSHSTRYRSLAKGKTIHVQWSFGRSTMDHFPISIPTQGLPWRRSRGRGYPNWLGA